MNAIGIPGCRHDVLGHNLKAIRRSSKNGEVY
jgi:hypothetical protein